jgi:hypothetical protein
LRNPKAAVIRWSDPSASGSRSASASNSREADARAAIFSRAASSIGWQKSLPQTAPPRARSSASTRSPVPQQISSANAPGRHSASRTRCTARRRQYRSIWKESR